MGKTNRILIFLILAFFIYSILWIPPRNMMIWQNSNYKIFSTIFQSHFLLSFYAFLVLILCLHCKAAAKFFNALSQKVVLVPIGIVALILSIVLGILNLPGLWWTWNSFGLQIGTVLVTYLLLEGKIPNYQAVIAGVAISGLAIGIWEIPYQAGMAFIYEKAFLSSRQTLNQFAGEVILEVPFILFGIICLKEINRRNSILKMNKWFIICITLTIALYALWFATGFHVETIYNWLTNQWEKLPVPYWQRMDWKASKVTLALGIITLVWKGRNNCVKLKVT